MSEKSIKNIELRSEEVRDVLTQTPHWMIRWGNLLIFILIALCLVFSYLIKYPDIIESEAIITSFNPPEQKYAFSTGKFDTIFINDKNLVRSGTYLGVLENSARTSDILKLKSIIDTLQINYKSFSFPWEEIPVLFLGDLETSYALFENSYDQYELNKRLQPFANETIANKYSILELKRRLNTLKAQEKVNKDEISLKENELERNKTLYDKGVISKQEFEEIQLGYNQAIRSFKDFESSISQTRENIEMTQRNNIGNNFNRTKEELILLKSVIQSYNQLKNKLKDWELKYLIESEISGKVAFMNIENQNQMVLEGDLLFTIIPQDYKSLIAKLKTPIENSGKIKIGQKVNLKITNYPYLEYGVFKGTITEISMIPDNDGFYNIDVDLPNNLVSSYGKEIEFKQQMKGSAEIITEDLRLLERLFYRLRNIVQK